jgi:steroid delta-isomerase-like uncharacterized protein
MLSLLIIALSLTAGGCAEMNKARTRSFYDEVFNTGKVELADQYIAAGAIDHEVMPGQSDPQPALANFKAFMAEFRTAFPDMKVQVMDLIAENDKVVARLRLTGTNKGPFMGQPATGKSVSFEFIDILRIENGKMVEHWGIADHAALMAQLAPAPQRK